MHQGLPLNLPMYVAQVLLVLGFTSGFVGLHNQLWMRVTSAPPTRFKACGRVLLPAGVIAIAGLLYVVGNGRNMPQTGLTCNALAVFMLTFLMLDADIGRLGFAVRGAALFAVGVGYYRGHYDSPEFLIVAGAFVAWIIAVWFWRAPIRYHVWRHIAAIGSIAIVFWVTLPQRAVGIRFTPLVTAQALGLSLAAIAVSALYLNVLHRDAVASAANAKKVRYDALTGAKSYAAFQADVAAAFTAAQAAGTPLTILTMDINHFKAINDQYGHLAGNDVLRGIAAVLHDAVAAAGQGVLYRTGGEEFTIVCQDLAASASLPLARACWQAVRTGRFATGDYQVACTLSCGIAGMRSADTKVAALFQRADENLYQSKQRGRDTITMSGQAVVDMRPERAMETYTFFTQRVVDLHRHLAVIANEIALGHYDRGADRWERVATPLPLVVQLPFMQEAAKMNTQERMSIYLSEAAFGDPATVSQLGDFLQQPDAPQMLWVTLPTLPPLALVQQMLPLYRHHDIRVIVTVTHLEAAAAAVEALLPWIDGVKLTLAGLRAAFTDNAAAEQAMVAWYQRCRQQHTDVVFEDVETSVDADYVSHVLHGHYVQGYVFDRPELPRLA